MQCKKNCYPQRYRRMCGRAFRQAKKLKLATQYWKQEKRCSYNPNQSQIYSINRSYGRTCLRCRDGLEHKKQLTHCRFINLSMCALSGSGTGTSNPLSKWKYCYSSLYETVNLSPRFELEHVFKVACGAEVHIHEISNMSNYRLACCYNRSYKIEITAHS